MSIDTDELAGFTSADILSENGCRAEPGAAT